MPWGYHLIVDCTQCNDGVCDEDRIKQFLEDLVTTLEMTAHGEPMINHFGHDNKKGYSAVQLITTSNISCHFCDESRDAYIDIFSCKEYDPENALECIMRHFCPVYHATKFISRTASR